MRRLLILRGGALGDFLVTLPFLRALRRSWPRARIELAGNTLAARIAEETGLLDQAHAQSEARWAGLYGSGPLLPEFSAWLAEFDAVAGFWADPAGDLRRHLPVRAGQLYLGAGAEITTHPAARHFLRVLPDLGITAEAPNPATEPPLELPAATRREAERRLGADWPPDAIAIHPGSGSPRKNWPAESWRALLPRLTASRILLLRGEAEKERPGMLSTGDDPRLRLADDWPLPVLAAALARCALFIGHDTGTAHLAAAVGTRCLLLFGPTDPRIWAPPGDHVHVLKAGPDLSAIEIDDVVAAIPRPPPEAAPRAGGRISTA